MTVNINDSGTVRSVDSIHVTDSSDNSVKTVARAFVRDGTNVREVFDYGRFPIQTITASGSRSNVVVPAQTGVEVFQVTGDANFVGGPAAGTRPAAGPDSLTVAWTAPGDITTAPANPVTLTPSRNVGLTAVWEANSSTTYPTRIVIRNQSTETLDLTEYGLGLQMTARRGAGVTVPVAIPEIVVSNHAFPVPANDQENRQITSFFLTGLTTDPELYTGGVFTHILENVDLAGGGSASMLAPGRALVIEMSFNLENLSDITIVGPNQPGQTAAAASNTVLIVDGPSPSGYALSLGPASFSLNLHSNAHDAIDVSGTFSTRDTSGGLSDDTWDFRAGLSTADASVNATTWADLVNNVLRIDPSSSNDILAVINTIETISTLTVTVSQNTSTATFQATPTEAGSDTLLRLTSLTTSTGAPPFTGAITVRIEADELVNLFPNLVTGTFPVGGNTAGALQAIADAVEAEYPTTTSTIVGNTLEINTAQNSNLEGAITIQRRSSTNTMFTLSHTFVDGGGVAIPASGVSSTYTITDYNNPGVVIRSFTGSVADTTSSDLPQVLARIRNEINTNTETPLDFMAAVNGNVVTLTGTGKRSVTGTWILTAAHNNQLVDVGDIDFGDAVIVDTGRNYRANN